MSAQSEAKVRAAARPAWDIGLVTLDFKGKGEVLVRVSETDFFLIRAKDAAEACARAVRGEGDKAAELVEFQKFLERFNQFLVALREWCGARPDRISACYLTVRDAGLAVYMVTRTEDYDVNLDADIDGLRDKLESSFADCPTELGQLPAGTQDELACFIDFQRAIKVYDAPVPSSAGALAEGKTTC